MVPAADFKHIDALPADMMREPLIWFFAEHFRHRKICKMLLDYSKSVILERAQIEEILRFLDFDIPLHIVDEERDLFPLLRRRCKPEDNIDKLLDDLSGDHAIDLKNCEKLTSYLDQALNEGRGLGVRRSWVDTIKRYSKDQLQHIAIENAVILPIARIRLTRGDQRKLGRNLAKRRGLTDPFKRAS